MTVANGLKYQGGITWDGNELPDIELVPTTDHNKRYYACKNCGRRFLGEEAYRELVGHLGTIIDETDISPPEGW